MAVQGHLKLLLSHSNASASTT